MDLISRQAAIDAIEQLVIPEDMCVFEILSHIELAIGTLPSARPEVKEIGYAECANALLKMWIDNILTDGEYNRVMDRLNAHRINKEKKNEKQNS